MKKHRNILQTLLLLKKIIPPSFNNRLTIAVFLLVLNSILEIFSIATLLPIFTLMLSPEAVNDNIFLKYAYNLLQFSSVNSFVIFLSITIGVFILLKGIGGLLIMKYAANLTYDIYKFFCVKLFDKIYSGGISFLNNANSSYLTRDMTYSTFFLSQRLVWPALTLINESVLLLLIVFSIAILAPGTILVIFLILIPFFIITYSIGKKYIEKKAVELHQNMGKFIEMINESVFGYVDIIILNKQNKIRENFIKLSSKLKEINVINQVGTQLPTKIIETFFLITIILIFVIGIFYNQADSEFISFLGFLGLAAFKMLPSINRVLLALIDIKSYSFAIDDLSESLKKTGTLDEVESGTIMIEEEETLKIIPFKDAILLKNIVFSYSKDSPILKNINITIKKGQIIGIIGRSGSGKSTFFKILLGFLYPQKGSIFVDGLELKKRDLVLLRKKISYVSQDIYLMDCSILENIVFDRKPEDVDMNKIYKILDQVELNDLVNSLPEKLNSKVGERGNLLSGGQKQRIGIARALYHNAEILLLDEATSALDQNTEDEITNSIFHLKRLTNITVLIIAHRYSTLKYCDVIYELKDGVIHNKLSYEELLNKPHQS